MLQQRVTTRRALPLSTVGRFVIVSPGNIFKAMSEFRKADSVIHTLVRRVTKSVATGCDFARSYGF